MNRKTRTILALLGTTTMTAGVLPGVSQAAPRPYERDKTASLAAPHIVERSARLVPVPGAAKRSAIGVGKVTFAKKPGVRHLAKAQPYGRG